jgi:hypothetical protein
MFPLADEEFLKKKHAEFKTAGHVNPVQVLTNWMLEAKYVDALAARIARCCSAGYSPVQHD